MKKKLFQIILIIVAWIVASSSLYQINEKEYIVIRQMGKIIDVKDEPGLKIKVPFIQSTERYTQAYIVYDIPESDVLTSDKKSMTADCYVLWQISDPSAYIRTLGGISLRAEERIEAATYNALKNTISAMTQEDVIASRGETLTGKITSKANSDIGQYGIRIITAQIKTLSIPDDNRYAVYERMISERQNIAAGYEADGKAQAQKIRNETDKETTLMLAEAEKKAAILKAEGEEEYMKIMQSAYNTADKASFYEYLRGLESLRKSLGEDTTLVLDGSSELAKILKGS